jgi:Histidine kinase-, DNA gyrase B-, and HSP90-like ATPase
METRTRSRTRTTADGGTSKEKNTMNETTAIQTVGNGATPEEETTMIDTTSRLNGQRLGVGGAITTRRRLGRLAAIPLKRSLRDQASKLSVSDALGELIDNAIDNYAVQQLRGYREERLTIDIVLAEDEIEIAENSGGVHPNDLLAFVQVGASGNRDDAPSIGVWGVGQKQAVAKLGYDVTIWTAYWDRRDPYVLEEEQDGKVVERTAEQVVLRMDRDWWFRESDWNVPVFAPEEEEELPRGETSYRIGSLNRKLDDILLDRLIAELQDVYGELLHARPDIEITVNGEVLEAQDRLSEEALHQLFASPPGFAPSRHSFKLLWEALDRSADDDGAQAKRLHTLRMDLIVGLTPEAKKDEAGVNMFGVPTSETGLELGPRMFARALQVESVGYSEGPRSTLRKADPTLGRLRIFAVFYGASEDIPWGMPGSPVKKGYNAANPVADKIKAHILEVAKPYARFTSKARTVDVMPFSAEWNKQSEAQRKTVLYRGLSLQHVDDLDIPQVAAQVAPLVTQPYEPGRMLVWDHTVDDEAPIEVPAFSDEFAKHVVSAITKRDAGLKQQHGDDPLQSVNLYLETLGQRTADALEEIDLPPAKDRTQSVSTRLMTSVVHRLLAKTGTTDKSEALRTAVEAFLADDNDAAAPEDAA